jgi:hypothetical protein
MKLNKISLVFAAMALVGCSSEDVSDFSANQTIDENGLVQLSPDFVLTGVGQEDATTRTHWDIDAKGAVFNQFLPIYNAGAAAGQMLDVAAELEAQAVGLCWLGQVPGTDVYTNYQFYHFGWLNNDETKAKFECNQLTNGSTYNEIGTLLAVTNGASGEALPGTDWKIAELPAKSVKAGKDNLNYNSGIYKTDNKAIFGGDYIVYYPYNPDFKDAGTIPAAAETTFNNVATTLTDPQLGAQTFRYSNKVTIQGGAQASDFGLKNLSTLVQLKVFEPKADAAAGNDIDQIVLYSAKKQLYKQVKLAADKIVAGATGEALYVTEECEGTQTITANFGAVTSLGLKAAAINAYITVLPTTVEDLVILVHNKTQKKWARIDKANTTFGAGKAKLIEVEVTNADFKAEYIAVDEASLLAARNEARSAGKGTVTVIGDITLDGTTENPYDFNSSAADAKITYTGDAIIVPEDVTLNTATNWESDIRVLGKSCCTGILGGRLSISGGTLSNVTLEPTEAKVTNKTDYDNFNPAVDYWGTVTIAAGKTFDVQAGNVNVWGTVQHKGDINIAEDVTLTVKPWGDLNFMGGTVVNNGTIEVMKNGKYDMTDANGNATANDGKRMTNNGTFIHNVDAGVGTAVQKMNQNGEYRCRVDEQIKLDDALLQWTACSVIEMVNTVNEDYNLGTGASIKPTAYKHNGKFIDFEINANGSGAVTTFNNPVVSGTNGDSKEIQLGNLTVVDGALYVDFVTGNGKRTLTVNGDMTVKAYTEFTDSKKINITNNLTVDGATLTYAGNKANVDGLAVTGDFTVSGGFGYFNAWSVDAINITCANFTLEKGSFADFGNRTEGDAKTMTVSGTITVPAGCTFNIVSANQNGAGSVLAWISCSSLIAQGNFPGSKPRVE